MCLLNHAITIYYLETVERQTDVRRPLAFAELYAMVFSAGGLITKATATELGWRKSLLRGAVDSREESDDVLR